MVLAGGKKKQRRYARATARGLPRRQRSTSWCRRSRSRVRRRSNESVAGASAGSFNGARRLEEESWTRKKIMREGRDPKPPVAYMGGGGRVVGSECGSVAWCGHAHRKG